MVLPDNTEDTGLNPEEMARLEAHIERVRGTWALLARLRFDRAA